MRKMNFHRLLPSSLPLIVSAAIASAAITVNAQGNTPDHSVRLNPASKQLLLKTKNGEVKYYDTAGLSEVTFDKENGNVDVTPKSGEWTDRFHKDVTSISFAKTPEEPTEGVEITTGGIRVTEARGWLESAFCKWEPLEGATSYRVYIKGGRYAEYSPLDRELVRDYATYGRADMPGLPEGVYSMKIVPVIGGNEQPEQGAEVSNISVRPYDRSGFAHLNFSGVGAYNDSGELKEDARVIYVTASTAKTVTCKVKQSNKDGDGTLVTGVQAIIDAYQKGLETRPLAIRLIGLIKKDDLDKISSSSEGLQIKGKNNTIPLNITVEGIGDDATTWGFGFLLRNACSVELRNFANMLCLDDCVSIDTKNLNCWVHHLDLFYGNTGGDSDQAKGDGTIDIKGNSQYITVAYNRFHDSGKSSLCGMKSESGPNFIDYHHNWFDHSDSRHPRVRTMSVHVWNNYFDGCAKYGVGATMGASVFVENNFFRSSKYPVLISQQGHDPAGSAGTFSKENGGMIKSCGNVYAETAGSDRMLPLTHAVSASSFDCYEAPTADEQVPSTYTTVYGGTPYNNFDTDPALMYPYHPLPAIDVPPVVTGYYGAGRMNHGDFSWDMTYEGADADYSVIQPLKTALQSYKSSLVGIFE